ncbi:gliding motility lipoprotein GldH [Lutibacter sp. TH_r2]|uniref:gliding motility lipoprotein GldH n=1 Tax=Lutibacter sp. TH_r2 TaxID=3082083 RepID=UPI002952B827|nr:gliding motility lipoprotein GldH [Lutibacter sp. TH_r2]MDV7186621.1 gliding motility lipoprotein GldH [Lutibacter sp. TH_r2]
MRNLAAIIVFLLLLVSCNSNEIYNQYQPIENYKWSSENKIQFLINNTDTISSKNVFINIRNNNKYSFSSIYLIGNIEFPSGIKVIDTLEYEMTNAEGKWLGTGFTEIKENKLYYKENVVFNEKGDYNFTIQQVTRSINDVEGKNPLQGITDVGLSIEKE